MKWLLGCSGFSYKDWKPVFYPQTLPTSQWLTYYSKQFNTLEVNTSFYHIPRLSSLQKWSAATPEDFIFSMKVPRLITHYKKMNGTKESLLAFYDLVQNGLQEKLGPLLFQFPPSFVYTEERLSNLLAQLEPGFTNVLEFRHASWWQTDVYNALKEKQAVFCSISHPTLPDDLVVTAPTVYFRFHGVPELYRSAYTTGYLDKVTASIRKHKKIKTAYLYFNNTIAAVAIDNLRYLQGKLGSGK